MKWAGMVRHLQKRQSKLIYPISLCVAVFVWNSELCSTSLVCWEPPYKKCLKLYRQERCEKFSLWLDSAKKKSVNKLSPPLAVKATYLLPQDSFSCSKLPEKSKLLWTDTIYHLVMFRDINLLEKVPAFLNNHFDFTAPVRMTNPNPGEHLNSWDLLELLSLSCGLSFFAQILICCLGN